MSKAKAPAPRRRVALIDLLARSDAFMSNDSMAAIAARLERDGHTALLFRSVLSDHAGGDLALWNHRLAAYLAAREVDIVVMPRAWEASTIDALRAAAPSACFIRLTNGVAAALDDRFDHVFHFNGFLAFIEGDERSAAPLWTRMTPRELRASEALRLAVVPLPAAGETHYEQLPNTGQSSQQQGPRPTITGPAAGCPFLLDSRKSDLFKNLPVDEDQVQMKGCTFCLDNVGTYTVPTSEAMVGSWMSQLRGIRAERQQKPGDRPLEVLCTDERPHPYLPALFRAIAAEPALGRIELLIKSRVDWLLEFADGAMTEALALATQSGSILHVYLVGFESFDAFHLELFNKGVSAADNLAAVDKLRELAARFPASFEYLRFRAHGIVLFTPWTRPEHLLENARFMRQARFHELRSEALRTRLRLYPRVPLHALAERDGLLVDKFDAGRIDRAVEQGYDASVPWRFQDSRTEAIFRVANTSELRKRNYTDADVLEAATRFVMRWPGLGSSPELAPLPFEQALRIWSPPPAATEGASSLGFDPEVDGIRAGVRSACLKEAVPRAVAADLVAAYRAMGLVAAVVSTHGLSDTGDVHADGDAFVIVAVARDEETLARVLDAQRAHRGHDLEAARTMGALMSYPSCCVDAFLAQRERGNNLENERCTFRRSPEQPLHPLVNRFAVVRLTSHHLCTPSCAPSVALAESLLAQLAELNPHAAVWVREQLSLAVLVPDYNMRIGLRGAWEGDTFRVDEATSFDDPRRLPVRPDQIARIAVSPDGAVITCRDGSTVRFEQRSPILATPGAPLAPVAFAAIAANAPSDAGPAAARETAGRHAPPPLPPSLRPGMVALGYRILSIGAVPDAAHASAHEVVLVHGTERLVLRLRAFDPARPSSLRRGSWAIDIKTAGPLPERARAALVLLARVLPV